MMRPLRRSERVRPPGIPLGFKLWFASVATLMLAILGTAGFTAYTVASDPAVLGRMLASVVSGYEERRP